MKTFLRSLLALSALFGAAPALSAITEACSYPIPADNGSNTDATGVTLDINGNCTLQTGDLITVLLVNRINDPTFTNSTTGGQTWSSITAQSQGGSQHGQIWYTRYNGTYAADPVFDSSSTAGNSFSAIVTVFRPTNGANTWDIDVAQQIGNTTPTTPFDVTRAGQTAIASSTVTYAYFFNTNNPAGTWALQTAGWNNPGGTAQWRNTGGGSDQGVVIAYKINTAAGATGSVVERQLTSTGVITLHGVVTFKEVAGAATPTFTAAPAIGTRTTSSIPITFTSDTDGTVYGARLTDGSAAPTCDQLEAQTATGGQQYFSEAVTATVADGATFGSITDGTVTDGYFCIEDGSGNDSAVVSIANIYKLPAFTTPLTIASQTDTAYTTNAKVLDGPGTVDLVACAKDASPPTVSQVEARTGGCIVNGATDDATGAMTLTITGTIFPLYDLYYVGSYGGQHEAAVHALADEYLDPPSGKQLETLASVSATSFCNDITGPAPAAGDVVVIDLQTNPGAQDVDIGNDCDLSFFSDGSRQSLVYTIYDASAAGYMAGGPGTLYYGDQVPACEGGQIEYVLDTGSAMVSEDLSARCPDAEGDTLTCSVTAGTPPTGTSVASNCTWSGTATLEDEEGVAFTVSVTDIAGESGTLNILAFPIDTIATPNVTQISVADVQSILGAKFLTQGTATYAYSDSVSAGFVLAQSPLEGTEVEENTAVDITVSLGSATGLNAMSTIFLADDAPVPATAVFKAGAAYAQSGEQYVAAWPANDKVVYQRGIAYRHDGAVLVAPSGTIAANKSGIAVTARGEIVVDNCIPTYAVARVPMIESGTVCMTDIN